MMNKITKVVVYILIQISTLIIHAQAPHLINYQGAARMADGTPLDNRTISVRFEFLVGSSSGSVIASETQVLQTSAFGLFSTRIGQNSNLSNINWQANNMFLRVGLDTSGGNNYTEIGVQQMVSVPYAIHASSVPSSYNGNILSIGNSTYALTPTVAVVPNTSITVSGLGTVSSAGTNTFDINIPAPTFTGQGATTVTGAYPNYTISSITPSIVLSSTAAATPSVTSSGGSFSLNMPPPTFSNTGQSIVTGSYPNFIVNTPTVGSTPNTTINASGMVTVSNPVTNSFVVGVPAPTLGITSGSITISGGNSVALPTQASVSAAGIATVSSGPNYVVGVPAPTLGITSGSITISGGNSVALPTQASVSAAGIATVSSGPNYMVGVQSPTFANVGQTIITGTYPNYSVNTPTIANTSIAITSTSAAGPSVTSIGTNSFNINIPQTIGWSLSGNAGTSTLTDFIGTTDNVPFNFKVNGAKSGTIDHILNNVYFGFQSGLSTTTASLNAGFGQEALKNISTANRNSAFGYQALRNSNGGSNTGIGASALTSNTTGSDNTAVGKDAMYTNSTSSYNVGVGSGALLYHISGDNNVALGRDALNGNTTGANNVAIGSLSGYTNVSGSGNVFIGNNAGYNETGSNKYVLANSSTSVAPLMYGDFSTGNVAIGTRTANAPLQFNNSITGRKIVLLETANNNHQVFGFGLSTNVLRYQVDDPSSSHAFYSGVNGSSSLELMRITGTGNVGIGTPNPSTNLHINSSSNTTQIRMTHTSTATFGLVMGTDNLSSALLNYDNTPMYLGTNGTNRLSIASTGEVNIGSFTTSHKLNVDGNISLEDASGVNAPSRVIGFPTASTGNHGSLTLQAKSQVYSGTAFIGGSLVLAGGNYNVGSPNTSGSFGGNVIIRAGHNLWPHVTGALIVFEAGLTSNQERMRIDGATGMVGIGTSAPDQLLTVNGNASKPGGGSWASFSDRRLKKDVHPFNDGLRELMRIEPVWYTYTGEANLPQETYVGVIAQDLQQIAPYMVKETSRGVTGETNYLSVDNSSMVYMIINSIKEQQKLIETLSRKIEEQKKEIEVLKRQ